MQLAQSPHSKEELLAKAQWLAGFSLQEIANQLGVVVPENLKRHKGWVGNLLELALGAKAGSKPEQDFAHLGVELKTIPVNEQGFPLETTFVSLAPLTHNQGIQWQSSHLKQKLACVLWIPVEGRREIPLGQRRIGQPILWMPNTAEEEMLRKDWEELMELIIFGRLSEINATLGEVLQLRPKGRNAKSRTNAINSEGLVVQSLPLGFYLRKQFTFEILQRFLNSPL